MKQARVLEALIKVHKTVQDRLNDRAAVVTGGTCPLTDLKGFQSVMIPTVVFMIADELGVELPEGAKVKNIYVSKEGKRRLDLSGVADRFCETFAEELAKA